MSLPSHVSHVIACHRSALTKRNAISAQRPTRAAVAVKRLLHAPRYHARMVCALATREHYANAVSALTAIAESDKTDHKRGLPLLLSARLSPSVQLGRIAARFGIQNQDASHGHTLSPVTLDEIQARLPEENARLVLACVGEIKWKSASVRERAAFALFHLIKRGVS
jgi:hypothetical protein